MNRHYENKIINDNYVDGRELIKKLNSFFFKARVVYVMERPQRREINYGEGHWMESTFILNDLEIMSQLCRSAVKKYRRWTLRCIV